jgi:molybdate-binding protein
LLATRLAIVQRDRAASSQQALDRALAAIGAVARPRGRRADGHLDAARTAATLDCAAVTTESAASAFGLAFLPLEEHRVEVWVAERWTAHPGLEALGELLSGTGFTDRISQFGGYELTGCGRRI